MLAEMTLVRLGFNAFRVLQAEKRAKLWSQKVPEI